jgi:Tfp pilus assembly protein PilF
LIQRYVAETLLILGDQYFSKAEKLIKKAIDSDKQKDMMWYLARDYTVYAEWFKRKSDLPKARENLSKAVEIFKDCGADGWVKKYEKELVSLS